MAGKVKVLCADKTGTLTVSGLRYAGKREAVVFMDQQTQSQSGVPRGAVVFDDFKS